MLENVSLRAVAEADFEPLAHFHTDERAAWLAGGGTASCNMETHIARLRLFVSDESGDILLRTVTVDEEVAGYIATFLRGNMREVSYWLGRDFWGKGVATTALKMFLPQLERVFPNAPIYARVVEGNIASAKVLKKAGFKEIRAESFFSEARQSHVSETLYLYK